MKALLCAFLYKAFQNQAEGITAQFEVLIGISSCDNCTRSPEIYLMSLMCLGFCSAMQLSTKFFANCDTVDNFSI